jgi:hypothetical protein
VINPQNGHILDEGNPLRVVSMANSFLNLSLTKAIKVRTCIVKFPVFGKRNWFASLTGLR